MKTAAAFFVWSAGRLAGFCCGAALPARAPALQIGAVLDWRSRAAFLMVATCVVIGALLLAFGARYALLFDAPYEPQALLSEIVRAPSAPAPTPQRPVEPPPIPRHNDSALAAPTAPPLAPAGEAPLITQALWITRPANPERFYPRAAFMRGIEGRVELACFVEIDGRLSCEVESEAPTGHGFGDAALAIAHAHIMRPVMQNGAPVRARYRMIVPFAVD